MVLVLCQLQWWWLISSVLNMIYDRMLSMVLCISFCVSRLLMNSMLVIRVRVSRVNLMVIIWNSSVFRLVSGGSVCSQGWKLCWCRVCFCSYSMIVSSVVMFSVVQVSSVIQVWVVSCQFSGWFGLWLQLWQMYSIVVVIGNISMFSVVIWFWVVISEVSQVMFSLISDSVVKKCMFGLLLVCMVIRMW